MHEKESISGDQNSAAYYDALMKEKKAEQDYSRYRAQLNAQLMTAKSEYLAGLEAEWAERVLIEEKKLELGYTTPVAVEEVRSQYASVQFQMEEADDLYEFYTECVRLNGGQCEEISVLEEWTPLDEDDTEGFRDKSSQQILYEQQISDYVSALQTVQADTEEAVISRSGGKNGKCQVVA